VDLVGALLDVARGGVPEAQPPGRPGVATHQLLLAVLGAAAQGRGRRGLAGEIWAALAHAGLYRGSAEELTPVGGDPRAALPVLAAAALILVRPALWHRLASGSVADYALTPAGWDSLLDTPGTQADTPRRAPSADTPPRARSADAPRRAPSADAPRRAPSADAP